MEAIGLITLVVSILLFLLKSIPVSDILRLEEPSMIVHILFAIGLLFGLFILIKTILLVSRYVKLHMLNFHKEKDIPELKAKIDLPRWYERLFGYYDYRRF